MAIPKPPTENPEATRSTDGAPAQRWRRKWRELGNAPLILFVTLSFVGCLLIIPRPTYPQILPLPQVERQHLQTVERQEVTRAERVLANGLSKEARIVGEQVRRIGLALSASTHVETRALAMLRADIATLLGKPDGPANTPGIESLLDLRALQAELFLLAVKKWEETGVLSDDLRELGGPFHAVAAVSWKDDRGALRLDDDELRLLFRVHWGQVTSTYGDKSFGPSVPELRRYYSINLQHPHAVKGDPRGLLLSQLNFARALGEVDPDYPSLLAQGILQLRMGEFILAEKALAAHLQQYPNGAWAHLARNHHLFAVRQANAMTDADL